MGQRLTSPGMMAACVMSALIQCQESIENEWGPFPRESPRARPGPTHLSSFLPTRPNYSSPTLGLLCKPHYPHLIM